jgi:adenylate kinase
MLIERAAGKRIDSSDGTIYHTTFDWPTEASIQQRLVVAENNTEEDLINRLVLYHRNIDGVHDALMASSKCINVDQPKGDVYSQSIQL